MDVHHPGLTNGPVYLDYSATTPVDPRVAKALQPYLTAWFGNPSSTHAHAAAPAAATRSGRPFGRATTVGSTCPPAPSRRCIAWKGPH